MQSLLNIPLWLNKSGIITPDTFFDSPLIMPHEGIDIKFMVSSGDAQFIWIQYPDGNAYPFWMPDGIEKPITVRASELSGTKIAISGTDWQGNAIVAPTGNVYWYGS